MLARRASNAFVCVRCELQLARRLPAYARRTSHASFSTSARRQDGAEELDAASKGARSPAPRIKRSDKPLERIRKRKGKILREYSAPLGGGMTRLGDHADVLVLREVIRNSAPKKLVQEPEPAEPIIVPDVVASLQQEHQTLTPEEVKIRLESLRPKISAEPNEPLYVPLKAFKKLVKDMNRGFTRQQLSQFYSSTKNVQQETVDKELLASLKGDTSGAVHPTIRTNWQPGTTPITKRLPGADVKTRSKRAPVSRELLVDRIVRDIWQLVPLEEIEALGELELSLKPWHITVLNAGEEETLLTKISVARKARIEVYQPHSVLRITADMTTADYAANDIEEALENHVSSKLQLKSWIPHLQKGEVPEDEKLATLYSDEDFRIITNITRASIQRMDNANTLVIRGLNTGAVAEAERALLRLLPLKDSATRTIDSQEMKDGKSKLNLLPASFESRSLGFKHQSANLCRWTSPVGRRAEAQGSEGHRAEVDDVENVSSSSAAMTQMAASIVRSLQDFPTETPSKTAGRSKKASQAPFEKLPKFGLSASFGQALFPMPDKASASTPPLGTSSSAPPLFTSSVPGLTSLMGASHVRGAMKNEQLPDFRFVAKSETPSLLLYDFIPAPAQPELDLHQVPPSLHIQMRPGGNSDGKLVESALHDMSLGFQEHVHTVLLPDHATDVQFTRYGRLHVDMSKTKRPVQDWLTDVRKNIDSGERLTAPNLTIPIPYWTITGNVADKGVKNVAYLFSAVQVRQTITGHIVDEHATYSSTQSSRLAAQGGALAMYYSKDANSVKELLQSDDDRLMSFVENSLKFADAVTEAAGQTQPLAKILRPRNSESARKQKRLAEQAATAAEQTVTAAAKEAPVQAQPNDDLMDLLDEAVAKHQDTSSKHSEEVDVHDSTQTEVPTASDQEQTAPSSDRNVSEDTADTPPLEKSEKPAA